MTKYAGEQAMTCGKSWQPPAILFLPKAISYQNAHGKNPGDFD
jgi:hypothetical protein